jgi:hypothetical protein
LEDDMTERSATNPFFLKAIARRRAIAILGGAGLSALICARAIWRSQIRSHVRSARRR